MDAANENNFETAYVRLNDELGALYDELRRMKKNTYRNTAKLHEIEAKVETLSRHVDRLRETFHTEYEIYEVIAGVESTYKFLLEDIAMLYAKPLQVAPVNRIVNYGAKKPRSSSVSLFNRLKTFTRRRASFGGAYTKRRSKKTRNH